MTTTTRPAHATAWRNAVFATFALNGLGAATWVIRLPSIQDAPRPLGVAGRLPDLRRLGRLDRRPAAREPRHPVARRSSCDPLLMFGAAVSLVVDRPRHLGALELCGRVRRHGSLRILERDLGCRHERRGRRGREGRSAARSCRCSTPAGASARSIGTGDRHRRRRSRASTPSCTSASIARAARARRSHRARRAAGGADPRRHRRAGRARRRSAIGCRSGASRAPCSSA